MLQLMGYLGSKAASGAFQAIIALMPVHDTFIDLFVGSGVILHRKGAAGRSYAVDLDAEAVGRLPAAPGLVKVCGDAMTFLDEFDYAAAGRVLVYADPPYLHSTRTSRKRYRHELTDGQHVELLDRLRRIPAAVILSGYPSALYDSLLSDWKTCEFQVMTRGGPRTEKLWFNFTPSHVHWAAFAGEDFTDRQRIKRKAARWAANYRTLPPGERLAVLAAILEVHHSRG
jgi:DNA adenine methylase